MKCGKCGGKNLEFIKTKDVASEFKKGNLAEIDPKIILILLGILGKVVSFFISQNKTNCLCRDCGLLLELDVYRDKYGDPK